jgi:tRNA threonylcarbamoyladenosine biosynthesis protein TsaE
VTLPVFSDGSTQETHSSLETEELAARLAAGLSGGDVVLISGELGAGKTTFVRGACRQLGVTVPVTSPTFTIGQRYPAAGGRTVGHVDLYRISSLENEDPDLLADYTGPDTITFVEWPEGAEAELGNLGRVAYRIRLLHGGGDLREVEIL